MYVRVHPRPPGPLAMPPNAATMDDVKSLTSRERKVYYQVRNFVLLNYPGGMESRTALREGSAGARDGQ